MAFREKMGTGFFTVLFVALVGAIIGGVMTAIVLPPVVEGQLPNEKEHTIGNEQTADNLSNEKSEGTGWEDIDPENYQDTPQARAAREAMPSVVGITSQADMWGERMERGAGSGVIIDPEGLIVTNYHVIQASDEVVVTMGDGESAPAEIIGEDPETDLAVLEVDLDELDDETLPAASFGDSDELVPGELAVAIGNPLGLKFQQSVTSGVVSATDRSIRVGDDYITLVQTDAAINPGNSGGPLVNAMGEIIGINSIKIYEPGVEGMGFAIPSNTVQDIVGELIEKGYVERPWIGIYVSEIDPMTAEMFDLPVEYGVIVEEIEPGSPANIAGLRQGDILIAMNDRDIDNLAKLRKIRNDFEVGDTVEVTLIREGEEITTDLTLESEPRRRD